MFDGLRKSKFYNKCKSEIRLTKTRLEAIKKRRKTVQKYLKGDIAELLKAGLDKNAYDRAEGLLVEQNMSYCYDFIEQICGCISTQLSTMNKQKECPEECRDAVPSLMYAAARFADLPELRSLRKLFTERYGNSLDPFMNKEFVERLMQKPPTKDMKLQLMHSIAQEYSIDWDSKALEQKLYTPPLPDHDVPKCASLNNATDNGFNLERGMTEKSNDQFNLHKREDDDGDKLTDAPRGIKDNYDFVFKPHRNDKNEGITVTRRNNRKQDSQQSCSSSPDSDGPLDYKFIPPPYTKPSIGKTKVDSEESEKSNDNAANAEKKQAAEAEAKPKAKSVRRRVLKPPPGRENDEVWRSKHENAKQGLGTILVEDEDKRDQEEKMIDGLLMHYSSKKSPYEAKERKQTPSLERVDDTWDSRMLATPARATSFPLQPTSFPMSKGIREEDRRNSLQPEMFAGHVHPKLPDYDELAARLAALSGR